MMAGVILILFIVGAIFLVVMDRWWCLLGAIFRGDSTYLKEDIIESGICEDKRSQWSPPPPPQSTKLWWNMTPEEKKSRREEWQRQEARRRRKERWLGPRPTIIIPQPQPRPQPRLQVFDPELNDLVRELYDEIDAD